MADFFKYAAQIIAAAAQSHLGLIALTLLLVGFLGFFFFRQASEWIRVAIYVLTLLGAAIFIAVILTIKPTPPPIPPPPPPPPPPRVTSFKEFFQGIPAKWVAVLQAGSENIDIGIPHPSKKTTFGLELKDNDKPVGAIRLSFFPANNLFKIAKVIDARLRPVEKYKNISNGGDKNTLQNWDAMQLWLGGRVYALRLGFHGGGYIRINYFRQIASQ